MISPSPLTSKRSNHDGRKRRTASLNGLLGPDGSHDLFFARRCSLFFGHHEEMTQVCLSK
jgi:hypothetical protein